MVQSKQKNIIISNAYIQGIDTEFKLQQLSTFKIQYDGEDKIKKIEVNYSILKIEATSARYRNKNSKDLIVALRLFYMANSEILKVLQEK